MSSCLALIQGKMICEHSALDQAGQHSQGSHGSYLGSMEPSRLPCRGREQSGEQALHLERGSNHTGENTFPGCPPAPASLRRLPLLPLCSEAEANPKCWQDQRASSSLGPAGKGCPGADDHCQAGAQRPRASPAAGASGAAPPGARAPPGAGLWVRERACLRVPALRSAPGLGLPCPPTQPLWPLEKLSSIGHTQLVFSKFCRNQVKDAVPITNPPGWRGHRCWQG